MSKAIHKELIFCTHCNTECSENSITTAYGCFCCEGCVTANKILNDGNIFNDKKNAAKKINQDLDCLLSFKNEKNASIEFEIPAIHCVSCIQVLENVHILEPAIESVRVNFLKKRATFLFNHSTYSVSELIDFLQKIGYKPLLNLDLKDKPKTDSIQNRDKTLLIKLGISGFVAGNIMLFSLPEYFGLNGDFSSEFKHLFSFLNLVLSLPVVFYCANDYFRSAFNSIRLKDINFDVPISLGFSSLLGLSYYEIISGTGAGYLDSFSALVFFLLVSRYFQNKTFASIDFEKNYLSYFPLFATKINLHNEEKIIVKNLKINDEILIKNNEIIPVNAILTKGKGEIDYSFITGESRPISLQAQMDVKAGAKWLSEPAVFKVKNSFEQNEFINLWKKEFSNTKEFIKNHIDKAGKVFLYLMIVVAFSVSSYWVYTSGLSYGIYIFTCLMVTACPCVLGIASPITNGIISRYFSKNGFFLKDAKSIYDFAQLDTIVFDKTGTLTKSNVGEVSFVGIELNMNQKVLLKSLFYASTHPNSQIIYNSILSETLEIKNFKQVVGEGISAVANGRLIKAGKKSFIDKDAISESNDSSVVWVCIDNQTLGYFKISPIWRENLNDLSYQLNALGIQKHVLSGDNDADSSILQKIFSQKANLNFYQKPEDKLKYIEYLQKSGNHVLMVGDGLNDALALKASRLSVSVIESGSSFFPSCDGVLESQQFSKLSKFIWLARKSKKVINICFSLSAIYNIIGIILASKGLLNPLLAAILMPLNSITVLFSAILFSNYYAKKILTN